jgi:hypothetical protein
MPKKIMYEGKKIGWNKKVSSIPKKIGKTGQIRIRPISAHMDNIIDKYVVSGGGIAHVVVGGKREALNVAKARIRVNKKRQMKKK